MTGRTKIIASEGAFHGAPGALAITHNPKYREPFEPLPGDVTFVPYGDAAALAAAVDDTVAAVVWSRSRARTAWSSRRPDYLPRAGDLRSTRRLAVVRRGADRHGPTGLWLVHVDEGVTADVVTWPRGWATGSRSAPASPRVRQPACWAGQPRQHLRRQSGRGDRRLAVIAVIERDGLLATATAMGEHLSKRWVAAAIR
jgi:acetylornithine aminotransferase